MLGSGNRPVSWRHVQGAEVGKWFGVKSEGLDCPVKKFEGMVVHEQSKMSATLRGSSGVKQHEGPRLWH